MELLILKFRVQVPMRSSPDLMINLQISKIVDLHSFEEAFIGVSLLYLITYGTLISFNPKYNHPLFSKSFLNLIILVLVLGSYLSFKGDSSYLLESISFSDTLLVNLLSYNTKNIVTIFSILSFTLSKILSPVNSPFSTILSCIFRIINSTRCSSLKP